RCSGRQTNGRVDQPLQGRLCALAGRPGGLRGRARESHRLGRAAEKNLRQGRRHLRPLVRRWRLQHLLQRARPSRAGRPQQPGRADLRFAGHQQQADLHLRPPAVGSAIARRHAARLRRRQRRPRHPLYADGAGSRVRHAGMRVIPYRPLPDEPIKLAKHKPDTCLILQLPQCEAPLTPGRDHDWRRVWEHAVNYAKTSECVPVLATDPLYILYTSGTTGIPKGVVRDNGGHMVALKWSMQYLYGVNPGEVWWSGSDVGWVVGHSFIVYAPLFHG